jgi:hypothetical protein
MHRQLSFHCPKYVLLQWDGSFLAHTLEYSRASHCCSWTEHQASRMTKVNVENAPAWDYFGPLKWVYRRAYH